MWMIEWEPVCSPNLSDNNHLKLLWINKCHIFVIQVSNEFSSWKCISGSSQSADMMCFKNDTLSEQQQLLKKYVKIHLPQAILICVWGKESIIILK